MEWCTTVVNVGFRFAASVRMHGFMLLRCMCCVSSEGLSAFTPPYFLYGLLLLVGGVVVVVVVVCVCVYARVFVCVCC